MTAVWAAHVPPPGAVAPGWGAYGPYPPPASYPPPAPKQVYVSAIDGVRAIAVIAVILFHTEVQWMQGGFIGVDLFFVISGYLIGGQLWSRSAYVGKIGLERFWEARARRLLPVLGVVLVVCALATFVLDPGGLAEFRGNLLSSMSFTTNWWFVFHEVPYFTASGRPSALQHLWSLAVEEQFYLVLPIFFVVLLGAARTVATRRRTTLLVVGGLALASATWMSLGAYTANVPYDSDGSRFYFGTDSHAFGLFLGVLLAVWRNGDGIGLPAHLRHLGPQPQAHRAFAVVGLLGLSVLGVVAVTSSEFTEGLYLWQLQLVALASAAVVAAASRRNAFSAALSWAPLRAIGRRSYGLYLWHWPVIVFTQPGVDVDLHGWSLVALQVVLTAALTEATYRLVEEPVRKLGWGGYRRHLSRIRCAGLTAPRIAAGVAVLSLAGTVALPVVLPQRGAMPTSSSMSHSVPMAPATAAPSNGAVDRSTVISAYGDSVMEGASPALIATFPNLAANTEVGAQASLIMDRVQADYRAGTIASSVVIHMGTNGLVEQSKLEQTLRLLNDRERVVLVTVYADRPWAPGVNELVTAMPALFDNVRLADWNAYASAHPEALYEDGIHVQPDHAEEYVMLVEDALG